jgi:hypothetical protein
MVAWIHAVVEKVEKLINGRWFMSFKSFLQKIGEDFKKVFESPIFTEVESIAGAALTIAVPPVGTLFTATAQAIQLAEQKQAALGTQSGTGAQKLVDVLQIYEPVIAQALKDAGKPNDTAAVTNYINAVVAVLNTSPAAAPAPAPAPTP